MHHISLVLKRTMCDWNTGYRFRVIKNNSVYVLRCLTHEVSTLFKQLISPMVSFEYYQFDQSHGKFRILSALSVPQKVSNFSSFISPTVSFEYYQFDQSHGKFRILSALSVPQKVSNFSSFISPTESYEF